jgi:hypothetical protein
MGLFLFNKWRGMLFSYAVAASRSKSSCQSSSSLLVSDPCEIQLLTVGRQCRRIPATSSVFRSRYRRPDSDPAASRCMRRGSCFSLHICRIYAVSRLTLTCESKLQIDIRRHRMPFSDLLPRHGSESENIYRPRLAARCKNLHRKLSENSYGFEPFLRRI